MKKGIPENLTYHNRFKLALCLILFGIIVIFKVSPNRNSELPPRKFAPQTGGPAITLVEITRQPVSMARPARPTVRLDSDLLVDDIFEPEIDILASFSADFNFESIPGTTHPGSLPRFVENPDRPPRVARIVEPVTPSFVFDNGERFRVYVRFLISETGSVEEIFITEIQQWNPSNQNFDIVQSSQPQIVEATMQAAVQWQFRPATDANGPVKSYSTHLFTFGR